jgi:hypothetical protein
MPDVPEIAISDPHRTPVLFVNHVVGSGHLNGVANITLATANFMPRPDGTVDPELVVSARLRMDMYCAQQLHAALGAILEQNLQPKNGSTH